MAAFPFRPWVLLALSAGCAGVDGDSASAVDGDGDGFTDAVDCDDGDPEVHPDAVEVCDGKDNDCNGETDMEDAGVEGYSTWYADVDDDGYGDADQLADGCTQPDNTSENADDCDDRDDDIHPEAMEVCDGQDNDCNGLTDIEDPDVVDEYSLYLDDDEDGFGDGKEVSSCELLDGYATTDGDCDDSDAEINPGAEEICGDDLDSDCDGEDPECEEE